MLRIDHIAKQYKDTPVLRGIELTPDDERRTIGVSVTAKSTLAATNPVATALYVTSDGNGELVVAEMVPQVPGQMNMDGTQQEAPKLLKLVQHG